MQSVWFRGQEWLRVPDEWQWGLDEFVIVSAMNTRLILCRVEEFTVSDNKGKPILGGIRKVPVKLSELDTPEMANAAAVPT